MSGAAVGELGFQRRKQTEGLSEPLWGPVQLSVLLREVNKEGFGTGWKLPGVTTASRAPSVPLAPVFSSVNQTTG